MFSTLRPRLTFANVTSVLALFAALGGGAVAISGVTNSEGEIQACYDKKGPDRGEVRLLVKGKCTRQERKIVWSRQGPPGPAGEQGLQGQPGPPGADGAAGANGSARAYGRVSGQGVVDTARSTPGVTAVRLVEGQYCVTVPGLTQANAVIVPVMEWNDVDSLGGDTAVARQFSMCPPDFGVDTWNAAGTARDDAGFTFVIP